MKSANGVYRFTVLICITIIIFSIGLFPYIPWKSSSLQSVYIITLERSIERSIPLQQQLFEKQIPFYLFMGVDGKKYVKDNPGVENLTGLSPGTLGCWLSHLNLWKQISQQSKDALILEDDAILTGEFLTPTVYYDVIYYGYVESRIPLKKFYYLLTGYRFDRTYGHGGTHSYRVTPSGCKKILRAIEKDPSVLRLPVDLALIKIFEENRDIIVYTQNPVCAKQSGVESVIHAK